MADTIIVGKVKSVEAKAVMARQFPGAPQKREFRVAVIEVQEAVLGAAEVKEVRVAFVPLPAPPPPAKAPKAKDAGPPAPVAGMTWSVGQEAIFFLTPHFEEDFFFTQSFYDVIVKENNPNFDKERALLKRSAQLLADPQAGLAAKDADDRLLTVSLLLVRYKAYKPAVHGPMPQLEPIDARTSKRILEILLAADWSKPQTGGTEHPMNLFWQLGATPNDGWKVPENGFKDEKEVETAAKSWLKDNLDKFKIQQYAKAK